MQMFQDDVPGWNHEKCTICMNAVSCEQCSARLRNVVFDTLEQLGGGSFGTCRGREAFLRETGLAMSLDAPLGHFGQLLSCVRYDSVEAFRVERSKIGVG